MGKQFELILSLGTFRDSYNGVAGTNSGFSYTKQERGLALRGTSGDTVTFTEVVTGVKTILFGIKKAADSKIFLDNAADKLEITGGSLSGTGLTQAYVDGVDTDVVGNSNYHFVIAEFSAGISFATNVKIAPSSLIELADKIILYDSILSEKERSNAFRDYLSPKGLGTEKFPKAMPEQKPTSLNESGLVAAYNMISSPGGVLTNISGGGSNGVIDGPIQSLQGLVFDGVDDIVTGTAIAISPATDDITVCSYFYMDNLSGIKLLLGNGSQLGNAFGLSFNAQVFSFQRILATVNKGVSGNIAVGWNTAVGIFDQSTDSLKLYINGILQSGTATPGNIGVANALKIGARVGGARPYKGIISELSVYKRVFTEVEAVQYHNSFNTPVLISDFTYEGVGTAVPFEFRKGTGTYAIAEQATQDAVLSHIKPGYKYLVASGAGTIFIPLIQAYGTVEFSISKSTQNENTDIHFTHDNNDGDGNGYALRISNEEQVSVSKIITGNPNSIFYTTNGYIDNNTWYDIRILRTLDGEFTGQIRGGDFGDSYQNITPDTGGGSDPNPSTNNDYTTSKYFVLNFAVGDRISGIKITNSVLQ